VDVNPGVKRDYFHAPDSSGALITILKHWYDGVIALSRRRQGIESSWGLGGTGMTGGGQAGCKIGEGLGQQQGFFSVLN
jgi:hypothetical protein